MIIIIILYDALDPLLLQLRLGPSWCVASLLSQAIIGPRAVSLQSMVFPMEAGNVLSNFRPWMFTLFSQIVLLAPFYFSGNILQLSKPVV